MDSFAAAARPVGFNVARCSRVKRPAPLLRGAFRQARTTYCASPRPSAQQASSAASCESAALEDGAVAHFLDKLRAATCAATLALIVGVTFAADPARADGLGKQVFDSNCAACHQGGRNSVIPERTLDKDAISKYLTGGFALEAIKYQVENGKGAMPAWQDRLDEDEIAAVAQYVYDVASAGAWDKQ